MLNKKQLIILSFFSIPVIIIAGMVLFFNKKNVDHLNTKGNEIIESKTSINPNLFEETVNKFIKLSEIKMKVKGGIVPHHDLAGNLISDFFSNLKKISPNIKTFIILGPNHDLKNNEKYISGFLNWRTPRGFLSTDENIVEDLALDKFIKIKSSDLVNEHAIGALAPYIKYYFPDAEIAPIVLTTKENNFSDSFILSEKIKKYLFDDDIFLLSSVDFSHYLSVEVARKNDDLIIQAIREYDYQKILSLNSDYLDSPMSIVVLLQTMRLIGHDKMQIIGHTNSAELLKVNLPETTSYFTIFFGQDI